MTTDYGLIVLDVGHDRWANPYHPDLMAITKRMFGQWQASIECQLFEWEGRL